MKDSPTTLLSIGARMNLTAMITSLQSSPPGGSGTKVSVRASGTQVYSHDLYDGFAQEVRTKMDELVEEVKRVKQAARSNSDQGELLPGRAPVVPPETLPVRFQLDLTPEQEARRAALVERLVKDAVVERLALFRINQLQLYTEHTFAYADHQQVWAEASPARPLTPTVANAMFVGIRLQFMISKCSIWRRSPSSAALCRSPSRRPNSSVMTLAVSSGRCQ